MKTLIQTMRAGAVKAIGIIVLVAGLSLGAQAQSVQYLVNNGVVPIGASNVVTAVAVEGQKISVQLDVKLTGAGTAGVACILEASNNNSTWSPTPIQFWRAANGATAVNHITNFDVGPYTFLRWTIHNTNSVAVTNSTITMIAKKDYR